MNNQDKPSVIAMRAQEDIRRREMKKLNIYAGMYSWELPALEGGDSHGTGDGGMSDTKNFEVLILI